MTDVNVLVRKIKTWDKEEVETLLGWMNEIRVLLGKDTLTLSPKVDELIQMDALPTEPIPDELRTYPIWAVDKQGMALVGPTADEIEELASIQETYWEARVS